jgi:hypothetical protein
MTFQARRMVAKVMKAAAQVFGPDFPSVHGLGRLLIAIAGTASCRLMSIEA